MGTAVLVAGLGYGDEGKGSIVDYLCAKMNVDLVVRYNGGAQAAHNVVTPDGKHHTFSQIGSGFFQGANTYLSKFVLVDLLALVEEAKHLVSLGYPGALRTVYVDKEAVLITPYHRAANRIRETHRGENKHGSCGVGVGEARSDQLAGLSLRFGETLNRHNTVEKLKAIQDKKLTELRNLGKDSVKENPAWKLLMTNPNDLAETYGQLYNEVSISHGDFFSRALYKTNIVFEGAQGVLLDETYGFYPYNSWTNTTFENAETLLKEAGFNGLIERCGVLRTYMTRHGAGPFVTEAKDWADSYGEHNCVGPWQGKFRSGRLDLVALRYAVQACGGVDYLALTHMGPSVWDVCTSYANRLSKFYTIQGDIIPTKRTPEEMEELTKSLFTTVPKYESLFEMAGHTPFVEKVEEVLKARAVIKSYGPTCRDKKLARL